GAVIYEMATGTVPFPGATPVAIFESLLTRVPPPPSSIVPGIPAEFDRVVAKALEKDRELRYQSAADLRADLKRVQQGTATGVTAATTAPPTPVLAGARGAGRRRWPQIAVAAAAVAIAGLAVFLYTGRTRAFSERDPVVIADFVNTTGEAVFDDTLKE